MMEGTSLEAPFTAMTGLDPKTDPTPPTPTWVSLALAGLMLFDLIGEVRV